MRCRLTALIVMAFFSAASQTTENYYDYNWRPCESAAARFYSTITKTDSGYNRIDYFIREKSLQMTGKYNDIDCKQPNGYFRYFHSNGFEEAEGAYVDGRKQGLWLHYHPNQMMSDSGFYRSGRQLGTSLAWHANGYISDSTTLKEDGSGVQITWFENGELSSAGYYSAGMKQNGKWKYFHNNGVLSAMESYQHGRCLDKIYYDENGKAEADTTNKDRDAEFPGGTQAWLKYLSKKAYFPSQYKITNGDKAVVVVTFAVNEAGKLSDVFVSTPFFPQFDRIAENAVAQSPPWKPAIRHNRKVKSQFRQPVSFVQE
jgi:antitoxin component YwqK of YwqJK toxin-antitoxin module